LYNNHLIENINTTTAKTVVKVGKLYRSKIDPTTGPKIYLFS